MILMTLINLCVNYLIFINNKVYIYILESNFWKKV